VKQAVMRHSVGDVLVGDGATFASMGRRRTTEGRAIIAAHRDELNEAEGQMNAEIRILTAGGASPVRPEFERVAALWAALPEGRNAWAPLAAGRCPLVLLARRLAARAAITGEVGDAAPGGSLDGHHPLGRTLAGLVARW